MKQLIFLACILLNATGCSDEQILLRKAEKHLKSYLDYPHSYRRISWEITDTTWTSEILREELEEPLSIQEEKLSALSENIPAVQTNIAGKKLEISKFIPKASYTKGTVAATREDLEAELAAYIKDSLDLMTEISGITFKRDSLVKLVRSLEEKKGSDIYDIRMEIRFRAKMSSDQHGTFCSKILYRDSEIGILDTYYDGIRLK